MRLALVTQRVHIILEDICKCPNLSIPLPFHPAIHAVLSDGNAKACQSGILVVDHFAPCAEEFWDGSSELRRPLRNQEFHSVAHWRFQNDRYSACHSAGKPHCVSTSCEPL